jgi:hypothetical protein
LNLSRALCSGHHYPPLLAPCKPGGAPGRPSTARSWFDLDLSSKPYRSLRYHGAALRGVAFHPAYPLFASSADDATAHVFHGRVYADLMTNPLIVPGEGDAASRPGGWS